MGALPEGPLVSDGNGYLWGTTPAGFGTIFKIKISTGQLSTVVQFNGTGPNPNGAHPSSALVSDGEGSFWGTTSALGPSVFKVNATTGILSVVTQFGTSVPYNYYPQSPLVSDGAGFFLGHFCLWRCARCRGCI